MGAPHLTLASASLRRRELIARLGIEPDAVCATDIDETPRKDELPRDYARRMAREKALAAAGDGLVLAGDTVVALGRRILPKADTESDARACLELMSGRKHDVVTGVAVFAPDGRSASRLVEARVAFKRLSGQEIEGYISSGEWRGKAGGYAIQGQAGSFVTGITGSYSAIVGLPLYETASVLEGLGYPVARRWSSA